MEITTGILVRTRYHCLYLELHQSYFPCRDFHIKYLRLRRISHCLEMPPFGTVTVLLSKWSPYGDFHIKNLRLGIISNRLEISPFKNATVILSMWSPYGDFHIHRFDAWDYKSPFGNAVLHEVAIWRVYCISRTLQVGIVCKCTSRHLELL